MGSPKVNKIKNFLLHDNTYTKVNCKYSEIFFNKFYEQNNFVKILPHPNVDTKKLFFWLFLEFFEQS